jgi:GntR family transcriptional regulator / MocR family aminotransferase
MVGVRRGGKLDSSDKAFARAPKFFHLTEQDEGLPLRERLYRRIRHLILAGALPNGSRLAPSRALAESLGISRTSVSVAFERLIADGWLETRRSSGVYVCYSGLRPAIPAFTGSSTSEASVPFQLGWPSDNFPLKIWKRLQLRNWRTMPGSALLHGDRFGLPALRKVIAARLAATRGLVCSAEQIIVTTSIPAGVDLAIRVLGLIGEEVWVEDPCGRAKFIALLGAGLRVAPVPVDREGMDIKAAKSTAPHAKAAIVTPTCQAPTGATLSAERRTELVRWAEASSAWIFEDDFNWDADGISRTLRPIAAVDLHRTIYFNSFNHILFPGLRVAYFVVSQSLVERFNRIRGSEGDVNMPNQIVLTDFIEGGFLDDHLRLLNSSNAERRAALLSYIQRDHAPMIVPQKTPGGYFVCTLNGISESTLLETAQSAGIAVAGMSEYRMNVQPVEEVILGFSQFKPEALSTASIKLRRVLEAHEVR